MSIGTRKDEGRDEVIEEPDLPIIDAHHHLFDFPHGRYLLDDYLADARAGHNIVASVYVEIQAFARLTGPEHLRPLGEIEFANGIGAMCASGQYGPRVAAGIVGHADLRKPDALAEYLDMAMALAPLRFRGIRQVAIDHASETIYRYITHRPPRGILQDPGVLEGLRHLARRNLSFDAAIFHHQSPDLIRLADQVPDARIVLNHIGIATCLPEDGQILSQVFRDWRHLLRQLAERDNITCKLGGLGLPFWGFGLTTGEMPRSGKALAELWRPYIETAIEVFGPGRCMFESNYPPDSRACGFVPLWNAFKRITRDFSVSEKQSLYHRTAERIYRL